VIEPTGRDGDECPEPFLKWPGGKRYLADRIVKHFPAAHGRYYEPFVGSAALFFAHRPADAVLADKNAELIACYEQVRDNCEAVIRRLRKLKNSTADYYRIRAKEPTDGAWRAARLVYLVKLAFNGIYRVNSSTGKFNVPYGDHEGRVVFEPEKLRRASRLLQGSKLLVADFEVALADAGEGDLVYLDPPYTVAHNSNGFLRYNTRLFSWEDQVRLANCAQVLADRGCHVVVSNACHKSIRSLYSSFRVHRIIRSSRMAADNTYRRRIAEYLFVSGSSGETDAD
jgi:DNA adenine methylase